MNRIAGDGYLAGSSHEDSWISYQRREFLTARLYTR